MSRCQRECREFKSHLVLHIKTNNNGYIMSSWTPLVDRVLIKNEHKEKSDGGIFLPGTMGKNRGTVVAVGPGVVVQSGELVPTTVKPGDVVILPDNGHVEDVELDGQKYVVCREVDLLLYNRTEG